MIMNSFARTHSLRIMRFFIACRTKSKINTSQCVSVRARAPPFWAHIYKSFAKIYSLIAIRFSGNEHHVYGGSWPVFAGKKKLKRVFTLNYANCKSFASVECMSLLSFVQRHFYSLLCFASWKWLNEIQINIYLTRIHIIFRTNNRRLCVLVLITAYKYWNLSNFRFEMLLQLISISCGFAGFLFLLWL